MSSSTRPFDPALYLTLPRLNAYQALSLAQSLHAAATTDDARIAAAGGLTTHVTQALETLQVDREALTTALGPQPVSEPVVRDADRLEDHAVGALHDVLAGWARLAGANPLGDIAQALRDQLFGEGLTFINLAPREEWAVVETKLKIIDQVDVASRLQQLGLGPVVDHLRQTHVRYGHVTGATQPLAAEDTPAIRAPFDALRDSMTQYALAVLGTVSRKDPATRTRAEVLLAPLAEWRRNTPRGRRKDQSKDEGKADGGADKG